MSKRITVLISGAGSNLQALLAAPDLGGTVTAVVSDRAEAAGLMRAKEAGVATVVVSPADYADRPAWDGALAAAVDDTSPDLVVLAGFMRILSAGFVRRWPTLNVHPSLLPAFPGAHAVEDALAWGVKVTGCTVHLVDEEVDHGPIVAQEAVSVRDDDTPGSLHQRIKTVEHRLLGDCVRRFCRGSVHIDGRRVKIT